MNKLIRLILYITAGCIGVGTAALISGLVLGGGQLSWEDDWMFGRAGNIVQRITSDHVQPIDMVEQKQEQAEATDEIVEESTGYGDNKQYAYAYQEDYNYAEDYDDDYDEEDVTGDVGLLTIDASAITDLSVDLQKGYLSIEESDDNRIIVSASGPQIMIDEILAECESGKISIRDMRAGKRSREELEIYLQIPKDLQLDKVSFRINAGVVESDCAFQAMDLTLNADAGHIDLSDILANVFTASVGTGEMDIENGKFETAVLECGVGVMDLEADITKEARIECGMGSVNMELADGPDSVNYELYCGAGTIEIGDRSYSGLAKKSRLENGSEVTFTLECGMGQICID